MELLQLSSITSGWTGWLAANPRLSIGEMAFFTALAVPGALAYAKADPHWVELREPGHFDGRIDDDCARLAHLTPAERASLDEVADDRKEFARRMITSKRFEAIIARLRYQQQVA